MTSEQFFLGGPVDPGTNSRREGTTDYDPDDLTTHGVIVGMTGSGKTGLGIIYIEEALRRGIPTLVIDPKGDMTNLLLTFPDLAPTDFEPWIDEVEARRSNKSTGQMSADTAALWTEGLGEWGLGSADIRSLRAAADFTIYTPGSRSGVPVNLVGSLRRPDINWSSGGEILRDEIQSFVSGLLGLLGVNGDPISSREHILLSNLIEHGWRSGSDLDLELLVSWIQRPPLRKLGVFDVDAFYPESERRAFAVQLNGLLASPSFATWMDGDTLDAGEMLWTPTGKPRASILYLAHLSDMERQFVVTLSLAKVVSWMRRQTGTGSLRALVYIDEAFGFAPPVGEPPAKKPILTILKQGRAFGVGMLVATQNPMDLDYKAMSNAGTWNIGRLQTERDKARILEGLASAGGKTEVAEFDALISGLDKRQFILHSTRRAAPEVFTTRWAMSFLRGPLTAPQIEILTPERTSDAPEHHPDGETRFSKDTEQADDETAVMPSVASRVPVRFADAASPWASAVDMSPTSVRYQAALVATVSRLYDEARAGVEHPEVWEAIITPINDPISMEAMIEVDHDPRDFSEGPRTGASYILPEAPIGDAPFFRGAAAALKNHLARDAAISIYRNRDLNLFSRVEESRAQFAERCKRAADEAADAAAASLRGKYETKLERARELFETADRRRAELEVDVTGVRRTEWADVAGTVIDFLSGRRSARGVSGSARRRASVRSKERRLQSAREKASDRQTTIEELETELEDELSEIVDHWTEVSSRIEELSIGLERSDISVDELFIAWIPV